MYSIGMDAILFVNVPCTIDELEKVDTHMRETIKQIEGAIIVGTGYGGSRDFVIELADTDPWTAKEKFVMLSALLEAEYGKA